MLTSWPMNKKRFFSLKPFAKGFKEKSRFLFGGQPRKNREECARGHEGVNVRCAHSDPQNNPKQRAYSCLHRRSRSNGEKLDYFSTNSNANVDGLISNNQPISVQEHQGKGLTFIQVEERQQRKRSVGQLPPRHQKTQSQEKHPFPI